MDTLGAKSRLALLLDHFSAVKDTRQSWKVAYPLREVLFLVVCGTVADNDDYENIAAPGRGAPAVPAPLLRVPPWNTLRRLAGRDHEPDRSRPVLGLLLRLGGRMLAGQAHPGRPGWQDLARKS